MSKEIKSPYLEQESNNERISNKEIELLSAFKGHDDLLKLLRVVFYQDELTQEQVVSLKNSFTEGIVKVVRKIFQPNLDWKEPFFGQGSRWLDFKPMDILSSEVRPAIIGNQRAIEFIENGLKRLENISIGGEGKPLGLTVDLRMEKDYSNLPSEFVKIEGVAMQRGITFLESSLMALKGYADRNIETEEEKVARLKKDSSE